jgi:acylphosphatase
MESTMAERRTVYYSGRVQGVGFRYTATSIARGYAIVGYVQNLCDGRVVVVAEGEGSELDRYLAELAGVMSRNIRDTVVESGPATGDFRSFSVHH